MTDRNLPLHDPHLTEVAQWHPIQGTSMKRRVAVGCSAGAAPLLRLGQRELMSHPTLPPGTPTCTTTGGTR